MTGDIYKAVCIEISSGDSVYTHTEREKGDVHKRQKECIVGISDVNVTVP